MSKKSKRLLPSLSFALVLSIAVAGHARADCAGDRAEYQQKCVVEYQRLTNPQVKAIYDSVCAKLEKTIEKICARENTSDGSARSSAGSGAAMPNGQASQQGTRPSSGYSPSYGSASPSSSSPRSHAGAGDGYSRQQGGTDRQQTGTPVDQYGRECAQIVHQEKTRQHYGARHDIWIGNNCDGQIIVKVIRNSGVEEDAGVSPGGVAKFFCTDGYKGQPDCLGGYKTYSSRYPRR